MNASFVVKLAGAVALAVLATPGWAGGRGGHGVMFHAAPGFHGGGVPMRGFAGGGSRGGVRGFPPVSGVIHERLDTRPYYSAYGHTNTAMAAEGYRVPRVSGYGHTNTGLPSSHAGQFGFARYGHTATAYGVGYDRSGLDGRGARAFGNRGRYGGRLRLAGARRRFLLDYRGYGGFGDGYRGYGGAGIDEGGRVYAGVGTYGGSGTYGWPGTYGSGGTYGGGGTYAGGQTDVGYASETPLASRFAEPPLAPSPFVQPGDGDRYADAASEDVGYGSGPRVIIVGHPPRPDCACAPRIRPAPVVYRYGVGTAY